MAGIVTPQNQTQVAELYVGFFGRAPLAEGMSYWAQKLADGSTPQQLLANEIQYTQEYRDLYAGFTPEQQVTTFFRNVFGRDPLAAGLTYWASKVTATNPFYNVAWEMVNGVYNGGPNYNPADTALVQNKVAVSKFYAIDLRGTDRATADTAFYGVTQDPATVTAKEAEMAQSSGGTFTLTTGADTVNAAGNVLVTGLFNSTVGSTDSTLSAIDTITGNGANDTMRITYTGNVAQNATNAAVISGVENFEMRNTSGVLTTLDASQDAGLTRAVSYLSTGAVTVNNLAAGAKGVVLGNGTVTNGASTFNYVAGATAAALDITGGVTAGAIRLTGAGVTGTTINSTIAANTTGAITTVGTTNTINAATSLQTGGIVNGALTTLNVNGAAANVSSSVAAVALGTLGAAVTTVNASGLTAGGISATLNNLAAVVTGGAGNDTITTAGVQTGAVNAGAGTADKLIVATATDITLASGAKFTNFEVLQNNAAATVDASFVAGISSVVVDNAGASGFTGLSQAQANNVSFLQSSAGSTLALSNATGAADVVSITNTTTATATAINVTNLVVNAIETLNFTNNATAASTLSLAGAGSTGLKTIALSGAKGLTLDIAAAGTPAHATTLTAINASGLTAQAAGTNTFTLQDTVGGHALANGLTVTGSSGDDVVGFAATDTIANGRVVTVDTGLGTDAVTATLGQLWTVGSGWLAVNGGGGTDTLTISNLAAGTIDDNTFAHVSGIEKLTLLDTGAVNLTTGGSFNSAFGAAGTNGVTLTASAVTGNVAAVVDYTLFNGATTATTIGTATHTGAAATMTITGSAGADTVTATSGSAIAGGLVVSTGAGNDTITLTDAGVLAVAATVSVTGGTGADTINLTNVVSTGAGAVVVNFAVGDSTFSGSDQITGYTMGAAADTLDFAGATSIAAVAAGTAVAGYTAAQLTYGIVGGLLTFAGTSAASLDLTTVQGIVTNVIDPGLINGATFGYDNGTNTYVFSHNTTDAMVTLVGTTGETAVALAAGATTIVVA